MLELLEQVRDRINIVWLEYAKTVPIGNKALVDKFGYETMRAIENSDWDLAVKFSQYTHDLAKLSGFNDWYTLFLEVRRVRDTIKQIVGK